MHQGSPPAQPTQLPAASQSLLLEKRAWGSLWCLRRRMAVLSICFLPCRWVLGLTEKGWTPGEKGCDEREPTTMSLLHNTGWFLTRLLQQLIYKIHSAAASSAVVGNILLVSFPSPSSTGGEGKATGSRAHLCLYFVT